MPLFHHRRPLKRWWYLGAYGDAVMLCAGVARVAGMPQSFWAVWDGRRLHERTALLRAGLVEHDGTAVRVAGVLDLQIQDAGEPVEVVSRHGSAHIWTRKRPVRVTGNVTVGGSRLDVDCSGLTDESAGYHARRTEWEWSAGAGTSTDGRALVWNLVRGVHDSPSGSERTVWADGVPREVGPVAFSPGLDAVTSAAGVLGFAEVAARRRADNLGLIRSDYVQPFGAFSGTLPDGTEVARGWGVLERHRARW
jgi:uncharacterized protein DUF2804